MRKEGDGLRVRLRDRLIQIANSPKPSDVFFQPQSVARDPLTSLKILPLLAEGTASL